MKKIAFALLLALMVQFIPNKAQAAPAPTDPTALGSLAGAALLGLVLFDGGKASAKASNGDEFAALNNDSSFNDLLKQTAGGSLDTRDILK